MSSDLTTGLHVEITGDATSAIAATEQTGNAMKGLEGVSAEALTGLTAALEKLNLNLGTGLPIAAEKATAATTGLGTATQGATVTASEFNTVGANMSRMLNALGDSAGAAGGRVAAFAGSVDALKVSSGPIIAALAAMTVAFSAFNSYKAFSEQGISLAIGLQHSMETLKATVEANGQSWGTASKSIQNFIDIESMASGITKNELTDNLNHLAAAIGSVSDAERIMKVAEEVAIGQHRDLASVIDALIHGETGRAIALAAEDVKLKALILSHAHLGAILNELHREYGKQITDSNDAAMAQARAKVSSDALAESFGSNLIPSVQYLDESLIGAMETAGYFSKALGIGIHGAAMAFVDGSLSIVNSVAAITLALSHNVKGAMKMWGAAQSSMKATGKDFGDAIVGWVPALEKGLYDLEHLHAVGHGIVNEAIYRHNQQNPFDPNWGPQIGMQRGGGAGHSNAAAEAQKKLNNEIADSVAWLKREREEGNITTEQEIAGLERVEAKYKLSAGQRRAIENEIALLRKQERSEDSRALEESFRDKLAHEDQLVAHARIAFGEHSTQYRKALQDEIDFLQIWIAAHKTANQKVLDDWNRTLDERRQTQKNEQDAELRLVEEAQRKQTEELKKAHDEQLKHIEEFSGKAVGVLDKLFFEKGKNAMHAFSDAFRQMLEDMFNALMRSGITRLLERILGISASGSTVGGGVLGGGVPGNSLAPGALASGGGLLSTLFGLGAVGSTTAAASAGAFDPQAFGAQLSLSEVAAGPTGAGIAKNSIFNPAGGLNWGYHLGGGATGATLGSIGLGALGGALIGQTVFGGRGFADVGGATGGAAGAILGAKAGAFGGPLVAIGGALLGGLIGSLFGNHFDPKNEPDIYQQDAWGQQNADMQGKTASDPMMANGKAYTMDSWTQQLTKGTGWNIMFEKFVNQFRGKTSMLPSNLRGAFTAIESLWGGATNQANFNGDGRDGFLDLGSGKRALWSEFWSYVQGYGPAIAQLMDAYQNTDMFSTSGQSAMPSGTFTPSGSPDILHDFPDFVPGGSGGGGGGGGGGSTPIPKPIGGGGGGIGGGDGGIGGGRGRPEVSIVNHIYGNMLTENQVGAAVKKQLGTFARIGNIRSINRIGK